MTQVDAPPRLKLWCRVCQEVHPFNLKGINYHGGCGHVVTIHTVLATYASDIVNGVEEIYLPREVEG